MNAFIKYLRQYVVLDKHEEEFLFSHIQLRKLNPNEILLEEGSIAHSFYYNLQGLVRLYYCQNGVERSAAFYPEGNFISAYASFLQKMPIEGTLQATESTVLIEITAEAMTSLLTYSPKFEILPKIALEDERISHQKVLHNFLTLTPKDRYHKLLQEQPLIASRLPSTYLASYVGVRPEALAEIAP
ncbi:MAG: Crp/Fnr family transcriptional regulator [Bacteroidota bacterium]